MMKDLFPTLHDSARLWIWISERPLLPAEQDAVTNAVEEFLAAWTSHGRTIRGAAAILHDQVVILAGEIEEGEISGCGIDKSAHLMDAAAAKHGFAWSSALDIPTIDPASGALKLMTRPDFQEHVRSNRLSSETMIVDRTVTGLGDLRTHGLKRPARDSWMARYFRSRETSAG